MKLLLLLLSIPSISYCESIDKDEIVSKIKLKYECTYMLPMPTVDILFEPPLSKDGNFLYYQGKRDAFNEILNHLMTEHIPE